MKKSLLGFWVTVGLSAVGCYQQAAAPRSNSTSATTQRVNDWRYGSGICEVHHCRMKTVQVHDLAGCIDFLPDYTRARERLFPNAGVEYGPEMYGPAVGLIYVCPDCNVDRDN